MARKLTKKRESEWFSACDSTILYLECSDFRPPVREFYPFHDEFVPQLRPFSESVGLEDVDEIGMVFSGGSRQEVRFSCCWPVTRDKLERIAAIMPGVRLIAPGSSSFCKVQSFRVDKDGRSRTSLPRYYVRRTLDPKKAWFPVVPPTQCGTIRRTSGQGNHGQWNEYGIMTSDEDGLMPVFSSVIKHAIKSLWSVRVSASNGKSELILPTDSEGVTGFFNLREGPLTARGRRSALQHWVKEHLRRITEIKSTNVTGHYRGAREFDWLGFKCRVVPPQSTTSP